MSHTRQGMSTLYTNDILPFCSEGRDGEDMLALAAYRTDAQRLIGHQRGIARRELENRVLRQTSHVAAGLAQFIANRYKGGARDDANLDAIEQGMAAALAGGLLWSELVDYALLPSVVLGSDGELYRSRQASGPGFETGAQDPVEDQNAVYWHRLTSSAATSFEEAMIGAPVMLRSAVLPPGFVWANGDAVYFEDYPRFKSMYDKGGLDGYTLPASASPEDKKAWPGKWVLLDNGSGLLTPRLEGLFARYCAGEEAGSYQADAVQTGITSVVTEPTGGAVEQHDSAYVYGNVAKTSNYSDSVFIPLVEMGVIVPHYTFTVMQRMADKTRPENVALPIALYLGRPTEV